MALTRRKMMDARRKTALRHTSHDGSLGSLFSPCSWLVLVALPCSPACLLLLNSALWCGNTLSSGLYLIRKSHDALLATWKGQRKKQGRKETNMRKLLSPHAEEHADERGTIPIRHRLSRRHHKSGAGADGGFSLIHMSGSSLGVLA